MPNTVFGNLNDDDLSGTIFNEEPDVRGPIAARNAAKTQPPEGPGPGRRFLQGFGIPTSMEELQRAGTLYDPNHPVASVVRGVAGPVVSSAWDLLHRTGAEMGDQLGQAATAPTLQDAMKHVAGAAVPVLGPPIANGDIAGGLGRAANLATMVYAPEIGEGASNLAARAGGAIKGAASHIPVVSPIAKSIINGVKDVGSSLQDAKLARNNTEFMNSMPETSANAPGLQPAPELPTMQDLAMRQNVADFQPPSVDLDAIHPKTYRNKTFQYQDRGGFDVGKRVYPEQSPPMFPDNVVPDPAKPSTWPSWLRKPEEMPTNLKDLQRMIQETQKAMTDRAGKGSDMLSNQIGTLNKATTPAASLKKNITPDSPLSSIVREKHSSEKPERPADLDEFDRGALPHAENEDLATSGKLQDLLPDKFTAAKSAKIATPIKYKGTDATDGISEHDWVGLYGRNYKASSGANSILLSRYQRGGDYGHTMAHELGHAAWENDLTPDEQSRWTNIHWNHLNSDTSDKLMPSSVLQYKDDPGHSFAESFGQYVMNPGIFKQTYPKDYDYFKGLFGGKEFVKDRFAPGSVATTAANRLRDPDREVGAANKTGLINLNRNKGVDPEFKSISDFDNKKLVDQVPDRFKKLASNVSYSSWRRPTGQLNGAYGEPYDKNPYYHPTRLNGEDYQGYPYSTPSTISEMDRAAKYDNAQTPQEYNQIIHTSKASSHDPWVVYHELGHAVWYQNLTQHERERWATIHDRYTSLPEGKQPRAISDYEDDSSHSFASAFSDYINDKNGLSKKYPDIAGYFNGLSSKPSFR